MRGVFFVLLLATGGLAQEPPGPPPPPPAPPPPPGLEQRLSVLRLRLKSQPGLNASSERALEYSRRYFQIAESAFHAGRRPEADRFAAAADSLLHIVERQHIKNGGRSKGPPSPEPIQDHLQHVYFRMQQAEYFLRQAHDPSAAPLAQWARELYETAVRAYDRKELISAEENAKCADDVLAALENLAQAASIPPSTPPIPPPPPHP